MSRNDTAIDVGEILFQAARGPSRSPAESLVFREFCHAMRNRLNSLKLGLYAGRKLEQEAGRPVDPQWDEVERLYMRLEQYFNQVQAVFCPLGLQPLALNLPLFLQEKARKWRYQYPASDGGLALVVPDAPATAVLDPSRLGQALDQLAAWRLEAGGRPRLLMGVEDDDATLIWDEVDPPQHHSDPDRHAHGQISLAVLAKVVTDHSGKIDVNHNGGFRVRMTWPLRPTFATTTDSKPETHPAARRPGPPSEVGARRH